MYIYIYIYSNARAMFSAQTSDTPLTLSVACQLLSSWTALKYKSSNTDSAWTAGTRLTLSVQCQLRSACAFRTALCACS